MKKLLFLLLIGIMLSVPSCKKDSDKNEINPLALLALLGNSSLTVTATYTGDAATDGTGRMFVYLYKSLGTTTRDPEPAYKRSTRGGDFAEIGAAQTITIDHIRGGEYYVLVFYDYHTGGNDDNQTDRYILYSGTAYQWGFQAHHSGRHRRGYGRLRQRLCPWRAKRLHDHGHLYVDRSRDL